jgi:site-specific recombinase XerD
MSAAAATRPAGSQAVDEWAQIAGRAPKMADTLGRYLTQAATFLAPNSVEVADRTLRQLAAWLLEHTEVRTVADVRRNHIEEFKLWLAAQPGMRGDGLAQNTQRQRLRMLRVFFERIIEWDWPDAPTRNPIIGRDIPPRPEPLPKFLDDRDAARLMAAARSAPDPRDRLVGDGHWLRVPVGKLRNDRYVPLHPDLVTLLADWTAANLEHIRHHRRLVADHRGPLNRYIVHRVVRRVARHAGIHAHPHQLRHTLATQAINRGMRLEAIAALLGHRSMEMTLTYARIGDRVVADEYAAVNTQIDALYNQQLAVAEPPR